MANFKNLCVDNIFQTILTTWDFALLAFRASTGKAWIWQIRMIWLTTLKKKPLRHCKRLSIWNIMVVYLVKSLLVLSRVSTNFAGGLLPICRFRGVWTKYFQLKSLFCDKRNQTWTPGRNAQPGWPGWIDPLPESPGTASCKGYDEFGIFCILQSTCTVTGCFADRWHAYLRLTWPGLGLGEGQGWRGEGVGQGAGAGSIDSMDHQKPGESCWGERRGRDGIIWSGCWSKGAGEWGGWEVLKHGFSNMH